MGLNDSYAVIHSHFLSLDLFPSLSKIFSLVIQEERQKGIGFLIAPVSEPPSFINAAQGFGGRGNDKFFCTHCQKTNHTIDKCFQLHGYPHSFGRRRGRDASGDSSSHMQKSVHSVGAQYNSDGGQQPHSSIPSPNFNPLFAEQCHQIISYLQSQIQGQALTFESAPANSSSGSSDFTQSFSGIFSLTPLVASFSHSKTVWLIDTGATHHVCCSYTHFSNLTNLLKLSLPCLTHKLFLFLVGAQFLFFSLQLYIMCSLS